MGALRFGVEIPPFGFPPRGDQGDKGDKREPSTATRK
jgi:hypothetical protein